MELRRVWTHPDCGARSRDQRRPQRASIARNVGDCGTAVSLILLAGSGCSSAASCKRCEFLRVRPSPHLGPTAGNVYRRVPRGKSAAFLFGSCCLLLSAIPGVESVSSTYPIPFPYDKPSRFSIAGRPAAPSDLPVATELLSDRAILRR